FGETGQAPVLVVCNMTPVPRHAYRIGVPRAGRWREIANTDSRFYGGSDLGNEGAVHALEQPSHGEAHSILLTLPPLATVMLRAED
ncbi:MAG: 1,4-alpha-glucan branching enzyme, partial [Rhodospirillaceae bacterium]|nr:1,4-alpha-glucan branching enzyme [Rhodospirillaceae bacterium]